MESAPPETATITLSFRWIISKREMVALTLVRVCFAKLILEVMGIPKRR